ncbi:hypothetical protein JYU34_017866 [Plutella xylostella]|uniref:Uncharacterized protein n=1 Tax=Plutella xylostella TaxID=51655 RepID=A0ABQ7PZ66_PLUXY|nr:hypothetical protein JYU34_017866 [Plutella xylostella]
MTIIILLHTVVDRSLSWRKTNCLSRIVPPPSERMIQFERMNESTIRTASSAYAADLLRVVSRGGHRYVLGLQPFEGGKDISSEITVWDGVVVSPLAPAYQPAEPMDTDDKEEENSQDGVAA